MKNCCVVYIALCLGICLFMLSFKDCWAEENLINNYSFESGSGTTATSWPKSGEVGRETWAAQHLTYGMAFYGWMTSGGYFYQDISCKPNSEYYYRICSRYEQNYKDRIMEQSVTFYNSSMTYLSGHTNYINTATLSDNAWYTNRMSATAPANSAYMRVMFKAPSATPMTGPYNRSAFADNVKILGHTNVYRTGEIIDAFPYDEIANNPLHGKNWGHGFSGAWQESNPGSFIISDFSLGQITGYPAKSGVKAMVDVPDNTTRTATRTFNTIHTGKLYMAYVVNYEYSGTNKWIGASLMNGSSEQAFIGKISSRTRNNGLTIFPGGTNFSSAFSMYTGTGNDYLIVGKYDFSTRKLSTKAFYQGSGGAIPDAEPAAWDVTATLAPGQIAQINGIRLNAGGINNTPGKCYYDEIRLATNWWEMLDVSPQDPTLPSSGITYTDVKETNMKVSWTRGNGENVLVVCRQGATPVDPSDGTLYSADIRMGYGSQIGSDSYVVYQGSESSVTVTNLLPNNTYFFSIYEYNGSGSAINYGTSDEATSSQSTASPEINIRGAGQTIVNQDFSPSTGDNTDFGTLNIVESNRIHTFTIENIGAADLTLTATPYVQLFGDAAFSISAQPTAPTIEGSASNTFEVTFAPTVSGIHTGLISIANTDDNENPYTFAIVGQGTQPVLAYGPSTISLTSIRGTLPANQIFTITNEGTGMMIFSNAMDCNGAWIDWIEVAPSNGTLDSGQSITCTATLHSAEYFYVATYYATNTIYAGVAGTQTVSISWEVNKKQVNVRPADHFKQYGTLQSSMISLSYDGFLPGEYPTVLDTMPHPETTATLYSPVGVYGSWPTGGSDDNYFLVYSNGLVTITQRTLYVAADDFSKDFGDANPAFTLSYSNWFGSENTEVLTTIPTAGSSATSNSPTGDYTITVSGGVAENYAFQYSSGTLSITNGLGVTWHVPAATITNSTTMRDPATNGISYMQPVTIYTANQIESGQQTNAILWYRRAGQNWSSMAFTNDMTLGQTNFWKAEIAATLFGDNETIEYFIEVHYRYNLTTYIGTLNEGISASVFQYETAARSNPFTFTYVHNSPPVFSLAAQHTLPVGSSTNINIIVSDADGSSPTVQNTTAPAGSSFDDPIYSWTASATHVNSSNLVTFVADDQCGLTNSVVTNSMLMVVPFDSDSDDMSDGWEWISFATLTRDGTGDADGDGANDHHEYIAGTAPTSVDSAFKVDVIHETGGSTSYELDIQTQPGKTYTIEYRDTLLATEGTWQIFANSMQGIGTWTETNTEPTTFTFIDDFSANTTEQAPSEGYRVYRIRVEQQ